MSSSKTQILTRIRAANEVAASTPLPTLASPPGASADLVATFAEVLTSIGGAVVWVENAAEIAAVLQQKLPDVRRVVSLVPEVPVGNFDLQQTARPQDLADLDLAVLRGQFGVAENGAIWLDEADLGGVRVLPFIAQHLAIVLTTNELVADLHQAYAQLDVTKTGFGLFLAGPSKTADIEQSLVIGAHGARSLTVFLIRNALVE